MLKDLNSKQISQKICLCLATWYQKAPGLAPTVIKSEAVLKTSMPTSVPPFSATFHRTTKTVTTSLHQLYPQNSKTTEASQSPISPLTPFLPQQPVKSTQPTKIWAISMRIQTLWDYQIILIRSILMWALHQILLGGLMIMTAYWAQVNTLLTNQWGKLTKEYLKYWLQVRSKRINQPTHKFQHPELQNKKL